MLLYFNALYCLSLVVVFVHHLLLCLSILTKGKLTDELGKVRKQLDECRAENVSLFEKASGQMFNKALKALQGHGGLSRS